MKKVILIIVCVIASASYSFAHDWTKTWERDQYRARQERILEQMQKDMDQMRNPHRRYPTQRY